MRALFLVFSALVVSACAGADDGTTTDDSNELNEGRGSLERELDPPLAAPTSDKIGAKTADVLAASKANTIGTKKKDKDGCTVTTYKSGDKPVAQHVTCEKSETIRLFDDGGEVREEHIDADRDGTIDSYSSDTGVLVQVADTNFDGKVDLIIERVAKLKDFTMEGYGESFPKSKFLHRIREDRNRDGKLDFEKLTAKGVLPKE